MSCGVVCPGCLSLNCARALHTVRRRNPSLHRYICLGRLFHMSPSKPFQFENWDVDSSCRLAFSPAGGSAAHKTTVPTARCVYVHRHPLSAGHIPNPAPISERQPCHKLDSGSFSGISCGNLKALGIFKCSHQMNRNINYSAD